MHHAEVTKESTNSVKLQHLLLAHSLVLQPKTWTSAPHPASFSSLTLRPLPPPAGQAFPIAISVIRSQSVKIEKLSVCLHPLEITVFW